MGAHAAAPTALTPIVGRDDDLARLAAAAGSDRLVTITGPGGCGKTRLVIEAAQRWDLHGVVELAAVRADPAAAALVGCGVREVPGRSAVEVLRERLGRDGGVLVVDNCEHLRGPVAALVSDLLRHCAPLRVVTTSRAALGVPGEVVLPLAGLDPASGGAALLLDRARRVAPALPDDPATWATAAAVARMADGLPLAIELAAAHARSLPLAGIRDGMADRLRMLTARDATSDAAPDAAPDVEARHRSVAASVEWSAALVGAPARTALRALALMDGRFGLDTALAVAGDRDALQTLVEYSLLAFDPADERYRMLDTVRACAAAATDLHEHRRALDRLLTWAARFARAARDGLERAGPDALRVVERAEPAVCSAIDRALEAGHGLGTAATVAADLAFGWSLRGRCAMGLARTRRLVAALDPVPPDLLWAHGFLAFYAGDLDAGLAGAGRAVETGDDRARARGLILLGMAQAFVDPAAAEPVLAEAESAAGTAGDDWGRVEAAQCRAYAHLFRGDGRAALRCADAVLPVLGRLGHGQLAAWDAAIRADVAASQGRYDEAVAAGRRGFELAVATGEPVSAGGAWLPLLRALVATGHDDEASRVLDDGLRFFDDHPGLGVADVALLGPAIVAATGPAPAAAAAARAVLDAPDMIPAGAAEAGVLLAGARLRAGDPAGTGTAAREAAETARALGHRGLAAAADVLAATAHRAAQGAPQADAGDAGSPTVTGSPTATATAVAAPGASPATVAYDALGEAHELGLLPVVADALDLVAARHRDAGRDHVAARLHAAAARARAATGAVPGPVARALAPPPGWADDPARAGAWAEGARLGETGAVGYARRARGRRDRPRAGWEALTPTERQVVGLVATGRTNAEIGTALLVSPGTVRTHLRSVFAKLGVSSRTELAGRAATATPADPADL